MARFGRAFPIPRRRRAPVAYLSPVLAISSLTAAVNVSASSATSGSFTPAPNSLVVVLVTGWNGNTDVTASISDTLGGYSWTQLGGATTGSQQTCSGIFYAMSPSSPTAGTVTVSITSGGTPALQIQPFQITGVNPTTPVGATLAVNNESGSLSAAPASTSLVLSMIGDTEEERPVFTAPTGYTGFVNNAPVGFYTSQSAAYMIGAAETITWGDTNTGGAELVAIEILELGPPGVVAGSITTTFGGSGTGASEAAGSITTTFGGSGTGADIPPAAGSITAAFLSQATASVFGGDGAGGVTTEYLGYLAFPIAIPPVAGTVTGGFEVAVSTLTTTLLPSNGTLMATFGLTGVVVRTYIATGSATAAFLATAIAVGQSPVVISGTGIHDVSQRFIDAITTNHRWASKVLVYTPGGQMLADISKYVTSGSVSVDETAEVRRTCTVTVQGTTALVPTPVIVSNTQDLFHPATGNELWIWSGVQYPDGTYEYAQLGVFRMTTPTISDDGATITITINGQDRSSVVTRLDWLQPYVVNQTVATAAGVVGQPAAGVNIGAAIAQALQYKLNPVYPNLNYTGFVYDRMSYPPTIWGTDPSQQGDPMSDLITFAATSGSELFFNIYGNPIYRLIINPLTSEVLDDIHFVDGVNCTVTQAGIEMDETTAANGVIVYCNGVSINSAPVVAEAWDTDPGSSTYYRGVWGMVPFKITTTTIPGPTDTPQQAMVKGYMMAAQQLQLLLGSLNTINISCAPNPALQEGDCVRVTHARLNIDDYFVISQMTIPLDPLSLMTITFRPRVQAGGPTT